MNSMRVMTRIHRPMIGLLAANTISQVGSMLTLIALPWFVLQTTGSAAKTELTDVFEALYSFAIEMS